MSARTNASHPIATMAVVAALLALAGCAPSLPAGTRACVGFPVSVCQSQIAELDREGALHGGVAAYRLVCTAGSCTEQRGEGMLTVVFNDGTGREGSFGYATPVETPPGAPPSTTEPPLTVVPTCLGVPRLRCEDFARAEAGQPGFIGKTVTVDHGALHVDLHRHARGR